MDEHDQGKLILEKLLRRADADAGPIGMPQVARMIERLDDEDASGQRRLSAAILSDVGVIVKLLRMANASARGSHNIATIDQAITVLGLTSVKTAIATLQPVTALADKNMVAHLQAEEVASYSRTYQYWS